MDGDPLTRKIIGCAIEVHRALGPGLLESAYQRCLVHELGSEGLSVEVELPLPVRYKEVRLDCGYRIDVLVEKTVLLELKSVDKIAAVHEAQLLTYMRLAAVGTGLLINFNVPRLVDGIRRYRL